MGRPCKWKYPTKEISGHNKSNQAYSVWRHMIERCSTKYWEKYPTYIGTEFEEAWDDYDLFYEWVIDQKGYGLVDESGKKYHLDKDLLGCGKLYSPTNCVFLPARINVALQFGARNNQVLPGVSMNSGSFMATLCYDGKNKNLGRYQTANEAHSAYVKAKNIRLSELSEFYKESLSEAAYNKLKEKIN